MFRGGAEKSLEVARWMAEIAERHGAEFLDAETVASVDPVDGIHLDAEAHGDLGRAVAERLRAAD